MVSQGVALWGLMPRREVPTLALLLMVVFDGKVIWVTRGMTCGSFRGLFPAPPSGHTPAALGLLIRLMCCGGISKP